ncbi:hypothetical protein K8S17_04975 [bacterium]|nr:hypothetical protein [bacterium]
MTRKSRVMGFVLLALFALMLFAGCAVQSTGAGDNEMSDNPKLLLDELDEIDMDIANVSEELKAYKVQQQMEDGTEIRDVIRRLEMELYNLDARKAALKERVAELKAAGKM